MSDEPSRSSTPFRREAFGHGDLSRSPSGARLGLGLSILPKDPPQERDELRRVQISSTPPAVETIPTLGSNLRFEPGRDDGAYDGRLSGR